MPKTTRFNKLPRDEPRNANPDLSRSRDEGERQSAFAWNPKQISDDEIAAFLGGVLDGEFDDLLI